MSFLRSKLTSFVSSSKVTAEKELKRHPHSPITRRYIIKLFISYFIIIAICIISMAVLSYRFETRRIEDLAIKSNSEFLNQYRNTVDNYILGNIDALSYVLLQNIISDPELSYFITNPVEGAFTNIVFIRDYLNKLKATNTAIESITVYYSFNQLLVTTESIFFLGEPETDNIWNDRYLPMLEDRNTIYFWDFTQEVIPTYSQPETETQNRIIFIRKVLTPTRFSEYAGAVAITINEETLHNTISSSAPVDFGQLFIIDGSGRIISHANKELILTSTIDSDYGPQLISKTDDSGYFVADVNGERSIISYATSAYSNWMYVSIKISSQFTSGFRLFSNMLIVVSVITFLLAVLLSVIPTRHFYSPLHKLAKLSLGILNTKSRSSAGSEHEIIGSALSMLSSQLKEYEIKMESSLPLVKHDLLTSLIENKDLTADALSEKLDMLNIDFRFGTFLVACFMIGRLSSYVDFKTFDYVKLQIADEIENSLSSTDTICICTDYDEYVIALINSKAKFANMKTKFNNLADHFNNRLRILTHIGISDTVNQLANIHECYSQADRFVKYSFIYPEITIFSSNEMTKLDTNRTTDHAKSLVAKFGQSLNAFDQKSALSNIDNLISQIRKEHYPFNFSMKLLSKCINHLEDIIAKMKIPSDDILDEDIVDSYNRQENIYKTQEWFVSIINSIFNYLNKRHSEKNIEFIENVKQYIHSNILSRDLSLNSAAEAMAISPTYLSRLFKEETGINFVDYLMDSKLEAALEMLLNTSLKIEEISSNIGYSSSQYFIRKFKLKYAMTPNEYRLSKLRNNPEETTGN